MKAVNMYYQNYKKNNNKKNNNKKNNNKKNKNKKNNENDDTDIIIKINNSNTIDSIFNHLLDKIIYNKLNKEILDIFCKRDIKIVRNKKDDLFQECL